MRTYAKRFSLVVLLYATLINVEGSPVKKQKVCVIGAGTAGLVTTKQLAYSNGEFDVVAFEKNSDIGGLWIYSDKTGLDEHGLPVHSSLYKSLRTNTPKEIMSFPDYPHFGGENRSSVTHYTVLSYLRNYTEHFDLRKYIQFNTLVKKVTPIVGEGGWRDTRYEVETLNFDANATTKTTCDALVICNGNNFEPRMPTIQGIETFSGRVMHSHTYRTPESFAGQTVAILGAGPSGYDIAVDISDFAKTVYLSHNRKKFKSAMPANIKQVAGIVAADGDALILKDGTNVTADAVIYCTGYVFTFPFLDERSGITVDDNRVMHVYKHLINVRHPSMAFLGLLLNVNRFSAFYVQAKYVVALLKGQVDLPDEEAMLKDIEEMLQGKTKRHSHELDQKQWAYYNELARLADFAPLPGFYEKLGTIWTENLINDRWHFKEDNLVMLDNGEVILVRRNNATGN